MTFAIHDKLALIHIPRTAGRFFRLAAGEVGAVINEIGRGHGSLDEACGIPQTWYRKLITIKRHPVTWLKSWFSSTLMNGWVGWHNPTNALLRFKTSIFESFVVMMVEQDPGVITRIWEQYIGAPDDDRIWQMLEHERIREEVIRILEETGFELDQNQRHQIRKLKIPGGQRSEGPKQPLSDHAAQMLYESERDLFERLGYTL